MDDVQLLADLAVRHTQEVGQQDHIPLILRQLCQSVGQKIAGHNNREPLHFKNMLVHEMLVPGGGLLQLGSCQLAQGFFPVPESGIFTLNIPGLILQNLDTESAKLILNTLSTVAMIKLGNVYENMMVNLRPTNEKLTRRMVSIVKEMTGADEEKSRELLDAAEWNIKAAVQLYRS